MFVTHIARRNARAVLVVELDALADSLVRCRCRFSFNPVDVCTTFFLVYVALTMRDEIDVS